MSNHGQVDDYTFTHLTAWVDDNVREEERYAIREAMLGFLNECEPDELEYTLRHGWQHLYDHLRLNWVSDDHYDGEYHNA